MAEAVQTLAPIIHTLEWWEPTDAEGSWTLQARDGQGRLLAMSEQQSWEDALLAIAEELRPRR